MTFRILALLALALGALTLVVGLSLLGEGPLATDDLRHLRAGKERVTAPATYAAWTADSFMALPHGRPLAEIAPLERRGVSMVGRVQRTMLAGDGDFHLEITEAAVPPGERDHAYVTGEITPRWRRPGRWSGETLLALFRPNLGGTAPWPGGPRLVRVSGWLLYDYQYDARPSEWSVRNAAPRLTGWEIHPVTRLEVWNEARGGWDEVPS